MNVVEPIRSMDRVLDIADFLKERNERDYVLFMFGIYTGLRISDLLELRVRDVRGAEEIRVYEKKVSNKRRANEGRYIQIPKNLQRILRKYIYDKKDYEYLFKSRVGKNEHIKRDRAYVVLNTAGREFGLDSIGTHTLRKTFGFFLYQQTKDIELVREALGHTSTKHTKRYIGLRTETTRKAVNELRFER